MPNKKQARLNFSKKKGIGLIVGIVSYKNQPSCINFGNPNQNHMILIQGLPLEVEIHLALKTPTMSFPNHSLAENPFHPTASVCVP